MTAGVLLRPRPFLCARRQPGQRGGGRQVGRRRLQWGHDEGVVEGNVKALLADVQTLSLKWGHDEGVVEGVV